jgi:hypothetical protein
MELQTRKTNLAVFLRPGDLQNLSNGELSESKEFKSVIGSRMFVSSVAANRAVVRRLDFRSKWTSRSASALD